VLSFSRLHDEVCRKIGGISAKVLSNSDKIIFMSKALKQIANELKLWSKYAKSIHFAKTMLDTVCEFKINGISCQEIKNTISLANTESLRLKLNDLRLIYETYDLLVSERFIDPADNLTKLYYNLENYKFFKDKTVFIDGFKGFTGQQFKIIDRILTQSDDLYIALTNNYNSKREFDVFSNIRAAVLRIENMAKSHNVKVIDPIVLEKSYFNSCGLLNVEKILSDNPLENMENTGVTICKANTIFDEAEFVARTIRKLVRVENLRYRDFVIIARDSEKYAQPIEYACQKNEVNCFFDKKISLLSFPLSVAALSAIKALDFSTENILRFHKSGIGVLTNYEISKLENYTYLWNINGKTWTYNWDMDVRGFVVDKPSDDIKNELLEINDLRQKAIGPIINFKNSFKDNAFEMSKAIIGLFDECNVQNALKSLTKKLDNDIYSVDALKQSYNKFMEILDNIVTCYSSQTITKNEYYDALNLALSTESVGIIPQTIDQVVFGQADRIRPSKPKITFILGANQGVFPKNTSNNGVFAVKERKNLINLGLNVADNEIYSSIDENFLVYNNLCCASDKLYICYSTQTLKGESLSPSTFVSNIEERLALKAVIEPSKNLELDNLPETLHSVYSEFCRRYSKNDDFASLKEALGDKAGSVISSITKTPKKLTKENAQKLYGKDIYMSATKFDTFNRCKFSYFCKYGLRLQRLQPADFDVLQRGTIVHYVLEKVITNHKDTFTTMSRSETDAMCDLYIAEYLDSVIGYHTIETARHKFLISKISRSLKEVVHHLANEFKQSDFKPTHCELKIGGKDGIPMEFAYGEGKVLINGSIDRVDEYNGYIRVVDYKTGTKSFKLPDILFGLNLQMLIYLYALIRGQNLSDDKAAGIFYMPSKRDLNNDGMAMNGLMPGDIDLVRAMEKENKGEFVPALSLNKDGSISKTSTSFIRNDEFSLIFDHIERLMKKTGNAISNGEIEVNPVNGRESDACSYCDFKTVCRIENEPPFEVPKLQNSQVFEEIIKEKNNGI
jgi:ATP-dependent helicase/nuclease subunit B